MTLETFVAGQQTEGESLASFDLSSGDFPVQKHVLTKMEDDPNSETEDSLMDRIIDFDYSSSDQVSDLGSEDDLTPTEKNRSGLLTRSKTRQNPP